MPTKQYWPSMVRRVRVSAVFVCLLAAAPGRAGLYYSGELMADLPSQWRGFLLDQRAVRNIAVKAGAAMSPLRVRYQQAAAKLEKARRERKLTADELADLGALYVRLGEAAKAVDVLRSAQRDFPNHFRIAANLGTAWQAQGNLEQAAASFRLAIRLPPGNQQKAEEPQPRLIQQRARRPDEAPLQATLSHELSRGELASH